MPLRVPVEVRVNQYFVVDVALRTPDGLPLGEPARLSVHSNAYGMVLFLITVTAAAVLTALTARRLWHRFRGQPDRADLDRMLDDRRGHQGHHGSVDDEDLPVDAIGRRGGEIGDQIRDVVGRERIDSVVRRVAEDRLGHRRAFVARDFAQGDEAVGAPQEAGVFGAEEVGERARVVDPDSGGMQTR